MATALRVLILVAGGAVLSWVAYRHVLVYLVRRKTIVLTDSVIGLTLTAGGAVAVGWVPGPVSGAVLAALLAVTLLVRGVGLWLVIGPRSERILERAEFVLRGMGFRCRRAGRGLAEEKGRIFLRTLGRPASPVQPLRLRIARGIKKTKLFRANFRKFVVSLPAGAR